MPEDRAKMEPRVTGPDAMQQRLHRVVRRTLGLRPETDCEALEFRQVPQWDSLAHLQLILELEREFAVTIENDDVLHMTSVRNMLAVLRRLGA